MSADDQFRSALAMIFEVIITGTTTTSGNCMVWDFITVPHATGSVSAAQQSASFQAWAEELFPCRRAKPRPANSATGAMEMFRRNRRGGQRTREVFPPIVTEGHPDQRQLMAGYCNASLRRRRRWSPQPPPPRYREPHSGGPFAKGTNPPDPRTQTTHVLRGPYRIEAAYNTVATNPEQRPCNRLRGKSQNHTLQQHYNNAKD